MNKSYILGADIGGSHITCAAIKIETATIEEGTYTEEKVNSKAEDAKEVLDAWAKAINDAASNVGSENVEGIGLAIPGPFDYANGIALYTGENDKFAALYQLDIRSAISERTGIPANRIFFANDAACFGMGENWAGAGKGSNRMIGITLGTGFGAVYMKDGKHVTEGSGVPNGGELWDYPYNGTIAEDFVSTRWFIKRYAELTGETVEGVYDVAKIHATSQASQQIFEEFANTLANILSPSIKEFEATTLVIGGSIAKSSHLFIGKVHDVLASRGLNIKVATAELFDQAAILGAAKLVLNSI